MSNPDERPEWPEVRISSSLKYEKLIRTSNGDSIYLLFFLQCHIINGFCSCQPLKEFLQVGLGANLENSSQSEGLIVLCLG